MAIPEEIQKVREILQKSSNSLPITFIEDCISLLRTHFILGMLFKQEIRQDEADLLTSLSCCSTTVYDTDLKSICYQILNTAREKSNGACRVRRIFIEEEVYYKYFSKEHGQVTILGVKISPTQVNLDNFLIGVCESKFRYTEPKHLVVLGKLQQKG